MKNIYTPPITGSVTYVITLNINNNIYTSYIYSIFISSSNSVVYYLNKIKNSSIIQCYCLFMKQYIYMYVILVYKIKCDLDILMWSYKSSFPCVHNFISIFNFFFCTPIFFYIFLDYFLISIL